MKKYILILVSILCILSSVGCGEGKETMDIQGILVDGVFYEKSYQPMPAEVDESAIIGYVESYTDTIPKKDGESNIGKDIIGAPYAKVEGGIAILYENEWYLCKAETSEGVSIAPDVSDETISFHDKTFNKSDLSQDTIEWLVKYNSLSEEEQLAISGIPADLYELCGYPTTEDMEPGETLNNYANNLLSRMDTDKNKNDSTLDSDEFWENVIELIFYDFDENVYKTSDNEKLEKIQQIFMEMNYEEIENPWIEGWYQFEIQRSETVHSLGITSDIISFDGKFYKVTDSVGKEISSLLRNK